MPGLLESQTKKQAKAEVKCKETEDFVCAMVWGCGVVTFLEEVYLRLLFESCDDLSIFSDMFYTSTAISL